MARCAREGPTESFDVLDCAGKKTGKVIARDDAHETGVWHGAFHCLMITEVNHRQCALFQKRSALKKIAPNRFDVSVGGHYASGEDARVAGPREISEELGIAAPFSGLIPLGRRIFVYCFTPEVREYEFQDVFLLPCSIRFDDLTLQREELDGIIFAEVEQGIALFSGRIRQLETVLYRSDGSRQTIPVSAGDFVPCLDSYYLKLLVLARRYLNGEREALVI